MSASKCARLEQRAVTQPGLRKGSLSDAYLRRHQAKMEADSRQMKEMIRPILDREDGLMKEVEGFLREQDVFKLRRRELQHMQWTNHVSLPLQKRVDEYMSKNGAAIMNKRQRLYSHYLQLCKTKGILFLEDYDLEEYNPFVFDVKNLQDLKLSTEDLKERVHHRRCFAAGCKYNPQPLQYPSRKRVPKGELSRLDNLPYHITAMAVLDGRRHQTGRWFSSPGGPQHPTGLNQTSPTPEYNNPKSSAVTLELPQTSGSVPEMAENGTKMLHI